MPLYQFRLILSGITDLTPEVCDALYEAGCDDAGLAMSEGVAFLEFDREAGSFREALLSAVADAETAGHGIQVVRVEPDELVTISRIAERAGRTREHIRQLVVGLRGSGRFPPPVGKLNGRPGRSTPIWRWTDVAQWLQNAGLLAEEAQPVAETLDRGALIAALNALLELRRHVGGPSELTELCELLLNPRRFRQRLKRTSPQS
jgi:hypothetical protein